MNHATLNLSGLTALLTDFLQTFLAAIISFLAGFLL